MRAGLIVVFVSLVLAFAPAARAGVFPDLPGSDMLEEAIAQKDPGVSSSSSGDVPDQQDRVPAPNPTAVTDAAVTADQIEIVSRLPGGGGLPIIKDAARASQPSENVAPLVLFAALVVLAMTRFLFRLNELGRRPRIEKN